jgi:hypothetical protein
MRIITFIATLALVQNTMAQSYLDRTLYPERLHDDLEMLRSAIHEAHPDPYRYHTKAELDALIDRTRDSIRLPMSVVEFEQALSPVLKGLGDQHTRVEWPAVMQEALMANAILLPMKVRILPDGVYLEEELKGFRSVPVGSRILAINGRPMEEVVERLIATVIGDGANRTYAERVVEREFNLRYHLHIERTNVYRIGYRTPDHVIGEQIVFGMTGNEISNTRKPKGAALLPWGATEIPDGGVLWLHLRTLDPDSLALAGVRPDRFLNAMLAEANRSKVRTLVIDVRGAGGREPSMAALLFSAIAKTPFKMLDDIVVRSIAPPVARISHRIPEEHYANANARFLLAGKGTYRLPETDGRLVLHDPMAKAFVGKVYLISDGYTRDAAALLAMMVRRNDRGRVVGEEVGSNAFGFTGGPEWVVTAPTSGLRFHIPLLKYVPAGRGTGPTDRGEQPNHQAYQTPAGLANGRDDIRSSLLEMIRELE